MYKIIIFFLLFSVSAVYCQENLKDEYRITIKKSDNDRLWFELFHVKDFTIPDEVRCIFKPYKGLLIFPQTGTAFAWEDLDDNQKELILNRVKILQKSDSVY